MVDMTPKIKTGSKKVLLNEFMKESGEIYFYHKTEGRKIIPVNDKEKNERAKQRLKEMFAKYKNNIPKRFIENWNNVKLFDASGNVENAHTILLEPEEGSYDIKNTLNHLTGKEWTIFSCSWFIFNALLSDIKEEREICGDTEDHPATYSPTMMENFIKFFTKEGMSVIDPFAGIGSTLVGCKRTGRIGYGIELNKKYFNSILKRVPENVIKKLNSIKDKPLKGKTIQSFNKIAESIANLLINDKIKIMDRDRKFKPAQQNLSNVKVIYLIFTLLPQHASLPAS